MAQAEQAARACFGGYEPGPGAVGALRLIGGGCLSLIIPDSVAAPSLSMAGTD